MSAIIRVPSLLELSERSNAGGTNEQVKINLQITDYDPSSLELDISNLQTDVSNLSGAIDNIEVDLSPLEVDIENLDISLTKVIAEECLRSDNPVITGGSTTIAGYIEVKIAGQNYKLAIVAE